MSLSLTKKQTKKDHACINPFKAAEKVCTSQGGEKKKDPGTKDCKSFLSPNISSIPHTAALENSSAYTEILPQIVCLHMNEQKALSLDVALQGLLRRLIKCL